jgi:two-component system alkaline phosphatase synthesis response regulator PhoP
MTRNLLRMMLEHAGYRIREAADGNEALSAVEKEIPDVMILDVMMPNMDGLTVCAILRSRAETAALPILMLSARSNAEAVQLGLDAGADRYLTKPISHKDLVQHVEDVLSGVPAQ